MTNDKMKLIVLKSIIDGILRGIIIWCTTIILTSDALTIDLLRTVLFVIAGIVLSCVSMIYVSLINKDSPPYLIMSYSISMLFGATTFFVALFYMSRPFWNFISRFLELGEIGTVSGILIMYYQITFIVLTGLFRLLFLIICITKCFIRRKKYNCK